MEKLINTDLSILPEFQEKGLRDLILSNASKKTFSKEEVIVSQGVYNNQTGIILSGLLKVHLEGENSLILHHITPNNPIVNLMNLASDIPVRFSITTIEESTLLWIPNSKILELGNRFRSLKMHMISSSERNIESLIIIYRDLILMKTEERLLNYLKVKAMIYKNKNLKIPRTEMALDLNLSTSTISRTIKLLDSKKKIIQKKNSIILKD